MREEYCLTSWGHQLAYSDPRRHERLGMACSRQHAPQLTISSRGPMRVCLQRLVSEWQKLYCYALSGWQELYSNALCGWRELYAYALCCTAGHWTQKGSGGMS